jgi:DNA-directed RNA polymerase specialized sigma24 family protein
MDTDQTFREYLKGPSARRLGRVVKALHGLVWATALRMTGNAQDAEDITQDVFLDLLLHPPPPESVASVRGYIVWKVLGRATNLRRAERRREKLGACPRLHPRQAFRHRG